MHIDSHTPDARRLPLRWQLYTDGAWVPPDEDGNRPENEPPDAGYGVVEFTICDSDEHHSDDDPLIPVAQITANSDANLADCMFGKVTWSLSGTVQITPDEDDHIGALAHTNNTGELSAIYWALQRALQRPRFLGQDEIHSDSLYAINMTTGKWTPKAKRAREMVCLLRRTWRQLQRRRPHEVRLRHVRSHIKVPGNETADWLADTGRGGGNVSCASTARWLGNWLRTAQRDASGDAAGGDGEPQVAPETGDIRLSSLPTRSGAGSPAGLSGGLGWGMRRGARPHTHHIHAAPSGVG